MREYELNSAKMEEFWVIDQDEYEQLERLYLFQKKNCTFRIALVCGQVSF